MKLFYTVILAAVLFNLDCNRNSDQQPTLEPVAYSEQLWTGVAVSADRRIFVNYPRWVPGENISVAEIQKDRTIIPYPDQRWNSWRPGIAGKDHFVCVQSLVIDSKDMLWILDTGLDVSKGIVNGGAKLMSTDIRTGKIVQTYFFKETTTLPGTYLNDVRIDNKTDYAYITDSGRGAIIALNLKTGYSRRLLGSHNSTKSENITLTIEGRDWLRSDGKSPQINSDGIALNKDGKFLYYQALSGRTLYRIATHLLRDLSISEIELGNHVEKVAVTGPADGLIFDLSGNLYLTAIEENAIKKLDHSGNITTVVRDSLLKWPDSFAIWQDNTLYVTTSQIHLGEARKEPFTIFKISL